MTNNEILRADLLDIIFDKRNKDYGAYALRREYNHRLFFALSAVTAIILTFILMTVFGKKNELTLSTIEKKPGFVVKTVVLPKIQQPDKPEEIQRPKNVEKTATQKFTSRI
jgi:protein TonB